MENKEDFDVEDFSSMPEYIQAKLKAEQNFAKGLAAGIGAGVMGTILWVAITVTTGYQIGYMAIAVGAGVGFAIRFLGKGIDQHFGITGGIIAVLSCFLGNLISIGEITFDFIDLLFYGLAAYEGYSFAFRKITEEDIRAMEEEVAHKEEV